MKSIVQFFACSILILSCRVNINSGFPDASYTKHFPPGTIAYGENKFVDRTEITNESWCEYMYYTELAYGHNSIEFKKTLPDTTCWHKDSIKYMDEFYLRHPAYRDYPVVGISYKQALEFTKWRSDRVMEYLLVREGVFPFRQAYHPDTVFTITKWFTGKYLGYIPDKKHVYYPNYALPDTLEWRLINQFAQKQKPTGLRRKQCRKAINYINSRENYNPVNTYSDVTATTLCFPCRFRPLSRLKGNISEMSSQNGVSLGGSWKDSLSRILALDTFHYSKPNSHTGMRNVCAWKKWE